MPATLSRAAAVAALALLTLAADAAAQRRPVPTLLVEATGGFSLRETPLTFNVADVWSGSLRVGVPLGVGVEPWVAGAVAHLKNANEPCDSAAASCSNVERRLMIGASYMPGGRGGERGVGSPYVGVGLGARWFRGKTDLAHSVVLGLPIASGSALAPVIELRSESYRGFGNELLIVAVGLRAGL